MEFKFKDKYTSKPMQKKLEEQTKKSLAMRKGTEQMLQNELDKVLNWEWCNSNASEQRNLIEVRIVKGFSTYERVFLLIRYIQQKLNEIEVFSVVSMIMKSDYR